MSGFTFDSNPSSLGGGRAGVALRLLGGGGGSSGGSGMGGGSTRSQHRFTLRNAFKTNHIGQYGTDAIDTYTFTRQSNPNGAIAGLVFVNGTGILPSSSELPLSVNPPFYNVSRDLITTFAGIRVSDGVSVTLDLTNPITFSTNLFQDTLFVTATSTADEVSTFENGASVTLLTNVYPELFRRAMCGPFRAALSAGDVLGRKDQVAGGANMVTSVRSARAPGWRGLAGSVKNTNEGDVTIVAGQPLVTGTGPGQVPIQSGNPSYVYDSSDFIRFKKLSAINKNYNDSSFGGPSRADGGGSGVFTALNRVRG